MDSKSKAVFDQLDPAKLAEALVVARMKLKERAKPSCRRCLGRGWTGTMNNSPIAIPCRCVKRAVEKERLEAAKSTIVHPAEPPPLPQPPPLP